MWESAAVMCFLFVINERENFVFVFNHGIRSHNYIHRIPIYGQYNRKRSMLRVFMRSKNLNGSNGKKL